MYKHMSPYSLHFLCYRIMGKFGGGKVGKFIRIWQKNVWQINRSAKRSLIVSTNLYGFSLTNHGRFRKLSCYTVCICILRYYTLSKVDLVIAYIICDS